MAITSTRHCAECDQPLPRQGVPECSWLWSCSTAGPSRIPDPSATKFGFCDCGVELARLIRVSAQGGEASPGLGRKAKRWLREARDGMRCGRSSRTQPRPRTHQRPSEEQRETSIGMEIAATGLLASERLSLASGR